MKRIIGALAVLLALHFQTQAWNSTGHRVIAALAYDNLTLATRTRVDDLIRRHPDYQRSFLQNAPSDPALRARAAFIAASVWADQIKFDARFYDDDRRDTRPTPLLRGFPDRGRHQYWHYVNLPFTQDDTRLRDPRPPHAVSEIERLSRALTRPVDDPANPVYALPWIIHLVGDLHNPLHAAARFTRDDPNGDRGGNGVYVEPGRNLHSFWDGLAGPDPSSAAYVDRLTGQLPRPAQLEVDDLSPILWAQKGVEIAKTKVYTIGQNSGSQDRPIRLSQAYRQAAKDLAQKQLSSAGYHLAGLLNRQLP